VRTIPSLPSQIAIGPDLIVLLAQPK
jgi:hypothetical protein